MDWQSVPLHQYPFFLGAVVVVIIW